MITSPAQQGRIPPRRVRRAIPRAWAAALIAGLVGNCVACGSGSTQELSEAKLRKELQGHSIPDVEIALPFVVDPGIRDFARGIPRSGAALERGRAVADAVRKLVDDSKARRFRWLRLPDQAPRTAGQLLAQLKAGTAGDVHSYEVAALTLAVARAAGIHSLMAEVHRQGSRVADPSGLFGAYAVAIYEKPPGPNVRLLGYVDAFGDGPIEQAQPQDDPTAVAGHYVLKSLGFAGGAGNTEEALRAASLAARLAPDSPLPPGAKGQAYLAASRPADALPELREAVHKRDDAPRHVNAANGFLAARELDTAADGMREAIARDPAFARAHLSLVMVLAYQGDEAGALQALAAAERLDPKLPGLGIARAHIMVAKDDPAGAERELRAEVTADPGNELAGLMLYGLLRAQKREADADKLLAELLGRSKHQAQLRQLVEGAAGRGP